MSAVAYGSPPTFNQVHGYPFRSGWVAWLAGENQTKVLQRAVLEINEAGRVVVALSQDRWSIWKRLLWALIVVVTLGFVGRSPGVVVISAPSVGAPVAQAPVAHSEPAPTAALPVAATRAPAIEAPSKTREPAPVATRPTARKPTPAAKKAAPRPGATRTRG